MDYSKQIKDIKTAMLAGHTHITDSLYDLSDEEIIVFALGFLCAEIDEDAQEMPNSKRVRPLEGIANG